MLKRRILNKFMKTFKEFLKDNIEESSRRSFGRQYSLFDKEDQQIGILTAFRRSLPNYPGGEVPIEVNRKRNKSLINDLTALEYGYTPVIGAYPEEDEATKLPGPILEEESFIVSPKIDKTNEEVRNELIELARKYDQDSVLIKFSGSKNGMLIFTSGDPSMDLGIWNPNKMAEIYTRMRWGANRGGPSTPNPDANKMLGIGRKFDFK